MPRPVSSDGTPLFAQQPLALGRVPFRRTDDNSENMAINGESTSTFLVWDGDTTAWAKEVQGTAETYAAHTGTYGLDSGVRLVGQETRFDYGSNQDIAGTYNSLSFWMMPKAYPAGAQLKILWRTSGGNNPGQVLLVSDYVSSMDPDIWQKVTIPIADFALEADVAKIVLIYATQGGQHLYFDEFYLNQGGIGPAVFRVSSPADKCWHVERVALVLSAGSAGWASTAFGNIADGLPNGLLLKYHKLGVEPVTYWTLNCRNNVELFGNLTVVNDFVFASSDLMVVLALEPRLSSVLLTGGEEVLDFLVRDNLSTLIRCRAFLHYGEETLAVQ